MTLGLVLILSGLALFALVVYAILADARRGMRTLPRPGSEFRGGWRGTGDPGPPDRFRGRQTVPPSPRPSADCWRCHGYGEVIQTSGGRRLVMPCPECRKDLAPF